MAITEPYMVFTDTNQSEVGLRAKVGESLLIRGLFVNTDSAFVVAYIDKTTVGYFRTGGVHGGHLDYPSADDFGATNLLSFLYQKGIFKGFPVAEGQTFIVKTVDGQPINEITILYELGDSGQYHPDMENGSESGEYFLLNYGRPSSVGGTGDVLAGICGSLVARGIDSFTAARAAAFISGQAGEIAAKKVKDGLLATDVINAIPDVIK